MTANHEHTPTIYDIRDQFIEAWAGDFVFGKIDAAKYFDRALDGHNARIRAAAEQRGAEEAIYELTEAIRFTVEYIGNDYLPPIDGWSWFDALRKYRPELAEHFERNPQLQPDSDAIRDVIADQRRYRADQIANKEGDDD